MNCEDFKKWLIDKDLFPDSAAASAAEHMETCESCARLFRMDLELENTIRRTLAPVQPSDGVIAALRMHVRSTDNRTTVRRLWRNVVASFAAAAAIAIVVFYSLSGPPGGMSELGMLAVENHMSGDRRMTIRVPNGAASPAWIAQTIGVAASPPDLQKQAFAFIGARPCKLGPVKAAYLFYEHEGKIASVFVVRTQDLGFSPAADRPYGAKIRGCDVKAWRRGDALYVLVI